MTVLILADRDDATADLVVRRLTARHRKVHRFALDDDVTLSATPGQLVVKDAHRTTANPRSVYWRCAGPVESARARELIGSLRALPDLVWVNHPDSTERACRAEEQSEAAAECGLALAGGKRIRKKYDLRVTAVGGRLFPCRIVSALPDWRRDPDAVFQPVAVPRAVVRAVYRLMEWYGLYYAVLDFTVCPEGTWHFVGCDPNGPFCWLERRTGLSISSAIATLLAEEPDIQRDLKSPVGEHRRSSGQD
ncbi:hypothetical protein [Streptomyces clavuligerus]|nr:hypothetical protein [Streptomyces clavuligerus]WDN52328.1 hypothetical protein LL058_10975 [Streptomyces clavuligerus]